MKKKILVTGSNGQLGKELQRKAPLFPQFDFRFVSKEELPVDDRQAVENLFSELHPQYLINCAAYTAVDKAEEEKELAFRINGTAVGLLATTCQTFNTQFLHVSTDYVFNGNATVPYTEDDPTDPQSVYGASKLEGEKLALANNQESIVIRTSWVYSEYGKNFVKTMIRLLSERNEISVVNDQLGSPTYAADLADLILQIIASQNWYPGIYHFSNEGVTSWYKFATAIKDIIGSGCIIHPIPTSQYPTPAKRPAWSALDKSKIIDTFGVELKDWKESLDSCVKRLTGNKQ